MRFVTEYANWKMKEIMWKSDTLYKDGYTENDITEKIRRIDRAVVEVKAGIITVDEAMREIAYQ